MAKRPRSTSNDDEPRGKRKLDPIIEGLIARLPHAGDEWPETERQTWLQLITAAFKVVYKYAEQQSPISTTHPTNP